MHRLITTQGMQEAIQRIFQANNCESTYHVEKDNVTFYAFDALQARNAKKYVQNNIRQDAIIVAEAARYFIETPEWDVVCAGKVQSHADNVAIETLTQAG